MIKANNIANIWQRLAPPSGGWGVFVLTAVLLLLAGPRYALAQNNSELPYLNSTHKYRVPVGNGTKRVWQLLQNNYTAPTSTIELTTYDDGGADWIEVGTEVDGTTTYAWITLKYTSAAPANFAVGQNWYLVYSEWDDTPGTGNCVALRRTDLITIEANLFSVLAQATNPASCNNWSDKVFPNKILPADPEITDAVYGTVTFTVNMNKDAAHAIKQWSFTGTITALGSNYSTPVGFNLFTTLVGTTTKGNYAITVQSETEFTLTVTITNPTEAGVTGDEVTFTANIHGPPVREVNVTMQINSAEAISGQNYNVATDDNGTGDKNQTKTLNPIPGTSEISMID